MTNFVFAPNTNEYVIFYTIYHHHPFKYPCTHLSMVYQIIIRPQSDNEYGRDWSKPLPTWMIYSKTPNGPYSDPVLIPTPSSNLPDCKQTPDNKQCIDSNLAVYIYPNGSLVGLGMQCVFDLEF